MEVPAFGLDSDAESRRSRMRFLRAHAADVYDELTSGRTRRLRLAELAYLAAEYYPGLVPTEHRLAAERELAHADRQGLEVDQGIFFREMLRVPEVGRHLIETMLGPTQRALRLLDAFRRTGRADLGVVRVERKAGVAHLTVHNEHCLNAETNAHVEDMETAVDLALLDPGVRVGVLRGAPMTHPRYAGRRVFSAGINLVDLHAGRISFVDFLLRREIGYINKIYRGLLVDEEPAWPPGMVEKPWIAAVDSFAIGGGAQLLLVFDHVIAAADSYFSLPAANEGIVPGAANLRLARLVGGRGARRIILSGAKIWASEPASALVFDQVVEPNAIDDAVDAAARRLASPAVVPNRHMIHLAEEPIDAFRVYLAEFALQQALRVHSPDVMAVTREFAAQAPGGGP
jgi:(3,5-dihydroxyphenyl)acetyl-CoA 1,2-dioxygenase